MGEHQIVIAKPHPLSPELVRVEFPRGSSILDMVGPNAKHCRVEIGGIEIAPHWWAYVRPKAEIAVHITRYPQGGGGVKNILRIVAFAALAIGVALVSAGTGSVFLTALGNLINVPTSVAAGLAAATLGIVGSLAINALIPPTSPSALSTGATGSVDTLKSITGTSNQANRFGAIPCVLGYAQLFPTYAALPWTEFVGDDQYLRCLFDLGWFDAAGGGYLDLNEPMKIGDTNLSSYTDVQTEVGIQPDLFAADYLEEPVGVEMDDSGDVTVRTTGTGAREISLDLVFPSGLFGVDNAGNVQNVTVPVRVDFVATGGDAWQSVYSTGTAGVSYPGSYFTGDGNLQINNNQRKAVRIGVNWKTPVAGQYDVRVIRYDASWGTAPEGNRVGSMSWTVLRTIRYGSASLTPTMKVGLRIKATDQLNGNISQFNQLVKQAIPVWNGSTWVVEPTEGPAWIFRWMLKDCPANPRRVDISKIDDEAIIAWGAECDAKGYTFSTVLDQQATLFSLLQTICAAGRASFNIRDGKYSVVRDVMQGSPVQVFTPRNSDGFSGSRAFPDAVHALRVQFTNPDAAYQQDERIVYDDGYDETNATLFATYSITGCTSAAAAWRLGRYHLAVLRLRPNTYTWTTDVEYLVCTRGNLVHMSSDVLAVGLGWGRVKAAKLNLINRVYEIETDEFVTLEPGKNYVVRVRKVDATYELSAVTSDIIGSETNRLTLQTTMIDIYAGDLFIFAEAGNEVLPLIITKIEPASDLSAKITAVDYAPDVLLADTGPVPPWSSSITGQPSVQAQAAPVGFVVSSTQQVAIPDSGGDSTATYAITVLQPSEVNRF